VLFSNFKLAHTFELENTWLRPIFLDKATSDGGNLIAWQRDQIALYNAGTGTKIRSFGSAHFEVESIAVSPDGKRVAAISGAELLVWSIENGFLLFSETLRSFGAVGWKDDKSLVVFDKSLREVQLVELETSSRRKLFSLPYANVTRFFFSDDRSRLGVVVQYETRPLMSQPITETDVLVFDTAGRTYGFLGVSSADGELRFSPDSTELWVEKEGMQLSRGVFAIPPKPQSALRRRWGRHHFVEKRREDILIEMNIPAKAAGGLSYAIRYSQRMISLYINGSEAAVDKFFVGKTTDFFIDPTGRSVFSIQQGADTNWKFQVDTRKVQ
jgi:dipeptidyl aminopeptidase/acylaminoacyl peptidase